MICAVVQAHWEFTAEIVILHHQTTMSRGYSPVMHIGVITQAAKIIDIKVRTECVCVVWAPIIDVLYVGMVCCAGQVRCTN